jgi:tetratricopeptide (TPR) repeat protein
MTIKVKRLLRSCAVVAGLAVTVSGCVNPQEGGLFSDSFWSGSPFLQSGNGEAERGLAELAKGNFTHAEGLFKRALEINSRDVHALLGLGILYQNTNQTTKAREMYEAILAIRPKESDRFVVWRSLETQPINEVASVNLALLESGGVLADLGRGAAGQAGAAGTAAPPKITPPPAMSRAPSNTPAARTPPPQSIADAPSIQMIPVGHVNVIGRFKTLQALKDEGLVTQDEFDARRRANIGSLLPLTSPPPAAGLDRAVPSTGQISSRLRAIGRALEMRALTVSQHAAERGMILDALMPAAPVRVANPGPPPNGLLEAADRVRLLEKLKEEKIISSDEYTRERKAIELAMQPAPTVPAQARKPAALKDSPTMSLGKGAPRPAVHIASFRSQQAAERGWSQIRRAHRTLLANYSHSISKVDLGPGKGIFYRLMVGPIATKAASVKLCRQLKQRRQFCEPGFMTTG